MEQVNMIGIDLAKNSFQPHGARADGSVAFRKKDRVPGSGVADGLWPRSPARSV